MKTLTVFTPTYNRAYCLENLYNSLKRQKNKDFIWLIIDDGSTDYTADLVGKWKAEEELLIHYHYQENQGMHGAHNTAYNLIKTELNTCIDSDDEMSEEAVEKIITFWKEYGGTHVSGIVGLDQDKKGNVIGTELPEKIEKSTLFDLYYKHRVNGDKKLVYRSELTKRYPYPIFEGEKYLGLAYKYYLIDQSYELLLMNEVLCTVEYLEDGSSMNMWKQYVNNPKGFAFYRKSLMQLPGVSWTFKFRQAIHYVSSSIFVKNKRFLIESPQKFYTLMALPLGLSLNLYIKRKLI
ncbi:glycosyltransferase family 2 protein [Jeotgalibacillus malaysiensis]|uniref:glycosyltransferase family 2 protein n=1 Tax=Jeotgalibacillus malaysiensis TaxID=1508404 RepID=UPI00384AE21D